MLGRNVMKEREAEGRGRKKDERGNKASMGSTGVSRISSAPKGKGRLIVSYKVDKYPSKKNNGQVTTVYPLDLTT